MLQSIWVIETLAGFRRVTSLSLRGSSADLSEADALRLFAAVPPVKTLFAVRTGTVFIQSERVQEAIFRLPHLTECGLDLNRPGGELKPSLLALAQNLRKITLIGPFGDLSPLLLLLSSAPHLRSLRLTISSTAAGVSDALLDVQLRCVEECRLQMYGSVSNPKPSIAQFVTILRAMPALICLTLGVGYHDISVPLDAVKQLGPSHLPALQCIDLMQTPRHFDVERTRRFLAVFLALEFRVNIAANLSDSAMLDVGPVTRDANGRNSVRRQSSTLQSAQ